MTDVDSLDILHMAAIAYADGQRSDPGTAELSRHLSNIPVPARLVLAAAILAAADKPVSTVNLCQVAGVSRGSAYNHHQDVMASIRESLPVLVRAQLAVLGETPSAAELFEQVRERDESIRQLRDTVATLRQDRDTALAYARDLHERLRPEFEAIAREKREKVRPLRAVPAPFRRARRPGEVTN